MHDSLSISTFDDDWELPPGERDDLILASHFRVSPSLDSEGSDGF